MTVGLRLIEKVHTGVVAAILLALLLPLRTAHAQSDEPAAQDTSDASTAEPPAKDSKPAGILPIPDYSGDLLTRSALLGDLKGARTSLADKGIQFGIDWSNTVQSVVSGGRDNKTAYGGKFAYTLELDLMRMGVMQGALLKLRAESRYGESVNGDTGSLSPVSTDLFFPLTTVLDEAIPITITTLSYTQFLSESFGVFGGKFDTLDGDGNEFASGRGVTQFQNSNFVFNPVIVFTVPYSTLGGGIVWKPAPNVTLTSSVFATADSSTTTGIGTLGDGWTWSANVSFQYRLGHLPGGVVVGGSYAWADDFATIGPRFVLDPGEGITPAPGADSSWAVFVSAWQYLIAEEAAEGADAPLDGLNGRPDRQGVGLFARLGFADPDTNPIELAVSVGAGGRGIIPKRDDDIFGIAYFYNAVRTDRLAALTPVRDSYQGFEAFYNIAVTPAVGLTLDIQVVQPLADLVDTAVVLGARVLVHF